MVEAVTIQRSGNSLIITIPAEICEWLDLKEQSQVEIEPFNCGGENGARIRVRK